MRALKIFLPFAILAMFLLLAASVYGLPLMDEAQHVPHPIPGRLDCLGCHRSGEDFYEEHQAPTNDTCTLCHLVVDTSGIPTIPHPTEGREDCLVCHGPDQVKPFPADHQDRTEASCQGCHRQGAATTPQATAATAAAIPLIPHPIEGREDCLVCHGPGQVMPFPADHEGRTKESCLGCHQPGATAAPTSQATAAATAAAIPLIPHPIEGREDCLVCHGPGQVKPFPADHQGRTKESCQGCHHPSATAAPTSQATAAATAAAIPLIPHPIEGREDCLACHDPAQVKLFPADHEGRTKESCLGCHQPGATAAPTSQATAAATAATIPAIPHPIEGRDDCLVCHGPGQVKPFPADHQGRTKESCQGCHQPGAVVTPQPTAILPPSVAVVPTPIHEPVMFEENTCITCHRGLGGKYAQITEDWTESIHAERGVGCVSCHGGDPTQADAAAAMSPEAGYLGPLPKDSIPGLCGSCHSRVDLMRQFDLPTDQLDQYWQSQHGQALLQGDPNVATCFDCHDGHHVLKVSDPASQVYPNNEPAMCAGCHADQALMAPYNIPTDQYELYQKSVHGVALLQKQDLRAPTCSTCHGKHGAAPPGFQQVPNVCGQCHSVTEDYYLQGAHRSGMTGEAAPRCVTCHGRHDVEPATRDLFLGTEDRHCGSCHQPGSEIVGQVDAIYQALKEADDAYANAEETITLATQDRLIMAEQEELLHKANTPLIESRALQHTVDLEQIKAKAAESSEISLQAQASAEAALKEIDTRRLGMIVALAVILVTIVALVLIKRELDRDLEAKRARRRGQSAEPPPV
jgi:hypothetical protein